jgi:arylsulfatase A-like enzyme
MLLIVLLLAGSAIAVDKPNVIMLGIDTMRGDYLHCAGNDWIQTPHMDALAADGVLFKKCYSTAPWTLPSFASIFTGQLPYRHGAIGGDYLRLDENLNTLAEYFNALEYITAGYVSINYLTPAFGMGQGFNAPFPEGLDPELDRASRITWLAQDFINQYSDRNFFAFLHYFDVHAPYTPPELFAKRYYEGDEKAPGVPINDFLLSEWNRVPNRANGMYDWLDGVTDIDFPIQEYASCVTYVDDHVGQLMGYLKENGLYDETMIILVSDHGEHLGEHDIFFTHAMPYHEAIHVPLMIKFPRNELHGTVIETPVSTMDIMPTVLTYMGVVPPEMDGRSLLGVMTGQSHDAGSLLMAEQGSSETDFSKTLIQWPWKLIYFRQGDDERYELFNIRDDVGETVDLAAEKANVLRRLRIKLWQTIDPDQPLTERNEALGVDMDENEKRTLRSLGY